jgi:hypothetical protein
MQSCYLYNYYITGYITDQKDNIISFIDKKDKEEFIDQINGLDLDEGFMYINSDDIHFTYYYDVIFTDDKEVTFHAIFLTKLQDIIDRYDELKEAYCDTINGYLEASKMHYKFKFIFKGTRCDVKVINETDNNELAEWTGIFD